MAPLEGSRKQRWALAEATGRPSSPLLMNPTTEGARVSGSTLPIADHVWPLCEGDTVANQRSLFWFLKGNQEPPPKEPDVIKRKLKSNSRSAGQKCPLISEIRTRPLPATSMCQIC